MIRSMISKTINSTITTLINPFDGLLSRYFVTLDPVLNSKYEITNPLTFTGDFEIESDIATSSLTGHMIVSTSNVTQDYIFVRSSTGEVGLSIFGVGITGTIVVTDGKLHTIKITKVGTTLSLFVDGVADGTTTTTGASAQIGLIGGWSANSLFYKGIIANVKLTDKSGASDVVTTFKLDQATANTESSVEGDNSLTYNNIPQSGRELYTLEDAAWVNNNELIVNGDFSSSGGWTEGSSWNIGGGNATCTGAYSLLTTAVGDTFNSSYRVEYTIESWSGGSIKMSVGGYDQTTSQTNNGTYTEIYNVSNPSSNTTFYVIPTSAVLSVDNISVKRAIEVSS